MNHSAETGPRPAPLTITAGSPERQTISASALERTSIQIMEGRRGFPSRSSATTEQLVVSTPRASISSGDTPAAPTAPRTAVPSALHQSSGRCSARPGEGSAVS